MKITKNFYKSEFDSKDGAEMPKEVFYNVVKLAIQLQVLRDYLGEPIKINSGYRSPKHNKAIGGVKNSQHVLGKASDIKVKGIKPRVRFFYLKNICKYKYFFYLCKAFKT